MNSRPFFAIVLGAGLVLGASAQAATRYVAVDGHDLDNDCTRASNPCREIQWAIDVADNGDVIGIDPGTYTINGALLVDKPLWIVGAGMDRTRIQAHATPGQASHRVMLISGRPYAGAPRMGAVIAHMTIRNGRAGDDFGDGFPGGGGILISHGDVTIVGVRVRDNQADHTGGGIMSTTESTLALNGVVIRGNRARFGGGLGNVVDGKAELTNVLVAGNTTTAGGGGGGIDSSPSSSIVLNNVTVSGNAADDVGGGMSARGETRIRNSIFWGNHDRTGEGTASATVDVSDATDVTFRCSLVQGHSPPGACNLDGTQFANRPRFVKKPAAGEVGNTRLRAGSPAINAGNNAFVGDEANDLDGNPRIHGGTVDMGAYEWRP